MMSAREKRLQKRIQQELNAAKENLNRLQQNIENDDNENNNDNSSAEIHTNIEITETESGINIIGNQPTSDQSASKQISDEAQSTQEGTVTAPVATNGQTPPVKPIEILSDGDSSERNELTHETGTETVERNETTRKQIEVLSDGDSSEHSEFNRNDILEVSESESASGQINASSSRKTAAKSAHRPSLQAVREKTTTVEITDSSKSKNRTASQIASKRSKTNTGRKDSTSDSSDCSSDEESTKNQDCVDDYLNVNYDYLTEGIEYNEDAYAKMWICNEKNRRKTNTKFVINYFEADDFMTVEANMNFALELNADYIQQCQIWKEFHVNRPYWISEVTDSRSTKAVSKHVDIKLISKNDAPVKTTAISRETALAVDLFISVPSVNHVVIEIFKRKKIFGRKNVNEETQFNNHDELVSVMTLNQVCKKNIDLSSMLQPDKENKYDALVLYVNFIKSGVVGIVCIQIFLKQKVLLVLFSQHHVFKNSVRAVSIFDKPFINKFNLKIVFYFKNEDD